MSLHQKPGGSQHPRLAKQDWSEMVFYMLNRLVNFPGRNDDFKLLFHERTGTWIPWASFPPLEEKVERWTREHPVVWNVGVGPAASFVQTLTRLVFERSKDLYYGPYDHIIRVGPPPAGSSTGPRWLALELLMEVSRTLKMPLPDQELEQLVQEHNLYGYGIIPDSLMLKALGWQFLESFKPDPSTHLDLDYSSQPMLSRAQQMIRDAQRGKRFLLLIENLHFPISLEILAFLVWKRPSLVSNRWIISTTSKDVYTTSAAKAPAMQHLFPLHDIMFKVGPECYYSLPFDDLLERDWAVLTKEALQDAARSIYNKLQQQQGDEQFWLHLAQHCLYYSILFYPLQGATVSAASSVSSDELVRCWAAEGLLSSITSPFDIPHGFDKQKYYCRSAYEAAKIVIQALQEYSLLPIYPDDSEPTSSSLLCQSVQSSQDIVTGLSKLANGVPRLNRVQLSDNAKSNRLRWVSFVNDDGRHVSWDWRDERNNAEFLPRESTISTLILRGCSDISGFPFDNVLNHRLRVLDLSYTMIDSLPPWLSLLLNLLLLSLRGCFKLSTLSPPPLNPSASDKTPILAQLGNLQVLDMNGVPLLEITQQDGSNKSNLRYLDLSGSKVITLPSEFFSEMTSLEELILGNCSNLKELSPSLAKLTNLLILHVEGTQIIYFPEDIFEVLQKLRTLRLINNKLLLPVSLSKANGLKEFHIYNCIRLGLQFLLELLPPYLEDLYIKAWQGLEDIEIHGHPNLSTFSLISGPWIRCLSLRGCRKLKTVNISDNATALKAVNLSGTAIEEVPPSLPNLPQLRMLLLLNVPCFKRFPWHKLARFPKVFCLDQSAVDDSLFLNKFCEQKICADEKQHNEKGTNTAQINVNDSRIFHSFNGDAVNKLVKEGQFLESFSVHVKPCSVRAKEPQNKSYDKESFNITRPSPYHDVRCSEATSIVSMLKLQPRQRHVEISEMDRYPNGLRQLLSVTHSIFLRDDAFVICLTDLNYSLISLEECQLQNCHEMKVVFRMNSGDPHRVWGKIKGPGISPLKILQASCLANLLSFVEPSDLSMSKLITLKLLRHIHLENCPRLEKMFPCSLSLPALESLVILFCTNLKTIFYKHSMYMVAPSPLPNIKRVQLQELPQLKHIHDDIMFSIKTSKWETLFVRGCRSFQRLPLRMKEYQMSEVKVSGERDWWDKLQWSLPEQRNYYMQVPPPEFASRKKGVVIKTYLR